MSRLLILFLFGFLSFSVEAVADERIVHFYKKVEDPREPKPLQVKKARVAIIIDDMGLSRKRGRQLIEMDAPLTLAFLPYADGLENITQDALDSGHELMIHMPMEAMNGKLDLGAIHLKEGMEPEVVDEQLLKAFESFDGYVGLNNHMGSRLTQNPEIMERVMGHLKKRGLYFVDSKTAPDSVAGYEARKAGLKTANRDVFLDHEDTPEFVAAALKRLERAAQRKGWAIAIGHPKDATIEGLEAWIPTLQDKGIELVHASKLTRIYDMRDATQTVAEIPQSQAQQPE